MRALSARRSYERQGSLDNDSIYFGDASRIGLEHDDGHPPETLSALTVTGCLCQRQQEPNAGERWVNSAVACS